MNQSSIKYISFITIIFLTLLFLSSKNNNYKENLNYKPPFVQLPHGKDLPKEPGVLPNEWLGYQRTYPYGTIKYNDYLDATRNAKSLHDKNKDRNFEWDLIGPENIGGRITDLAISNDNSTIYVGAASGGIFKTTNNGDSWNQIFNDSPVISIGDIAVDPNNSMIIYAGTGEANASSYSFLGNGIWKTTNGGITWMHSGLESSAYIGRIIVDYNNSERVFVAACGTLFSSNNQRGVYRSINAGVDWEQILFLTDSTAAIDLVMHPTNPNILYATMWERVRGLNYRKSGGETSGIWKTTDGGDNWTELSNGLPSGENIGRIGIDISTSNPNILYAFYDQHIDSNQNYSFLGIFKSINGGESWQQTNDNSIIDMNSRFGWYFGQIRIDPNNSNQVFAMGVDLVKTEDGGNSWEAIAGYWNTDEIHVDHHAMLFDSEGNLWIGNDGGLYVSDNFGESWDHINNIPLTQFYAIEIDNQNPYRIYGGTQDNNTIRTLTGSLDDWNDILGGDGFYTIVNPENSNIIYAEYQWGNLYRSNDGGNSMQYIGSEWAEDRTNWSSPFVINYNNPSNLYFGTYRVWKTINGGDSWFAISNDLTNGDDGSSYHTITTIAISKLNSNYILVGTDDGNIHLTINGGLDWENISQAIPQRWVTRVAFDPHNEMKIYATLSGFRWDEENSHVFSSNDLGQNWNNISSNLPDLPVNCIVLDPEIPNNIYIGTDSGIFVSFDSGNQWQSFSYNMPKVPITDLKIHNPTRKLVSGTYGLSAFSFDLNQLNLGDINQDGFVNVLDIVQLVDLILNNIGNNEYGDLNGDGIINIMDIILVINLIIN